MATRKRTRGIYLLPNLFTTSGLFAGFYSIISAMNGKFEIAAIAIFVAMIMDGLDGRIARLTNTQSDFGVQYDSLSDMVCFGLAPALIVYAWNLNNLGKLGWLGAFLYAAAAALRLARFNTQAKNDDRRYFQGLPSPAAAALVAGMIWLAEDYTIIEYVDLEYFALPITIFAGLLMVSNFRFHSFKEFDLKGKVPFIAMFILLLIFILIASSPPLVLFLIALVFAISGPVLTLVTIRKHRQKRDAHS